MSRLSNHSRSTKASRRRYEMRRRAELVDQTRQRIVEAAARLHTTVGPANTTIASIAAEADVTRLTVYRHFPAIEDLFVACTAHWQAAHPGPDPDGWRAIADLATRIRAAFADLYAWYADNGGDLFPIYRDVDAMPPGARDAIRMRTARLADALVAGAATSPARGRRLRAVARHLVSFWAWHSLAVDQGLGKGAADLASDLVLSTAVGSPAERSRAERS